MAEHISKFLGSLDMITVTDAEIKAKIAGLEATDILASAFLQAEIIGTDGNEFRRLKVAIGAPVEKLPLTVENIPFLTDAEIQNGFIAATASERIAFAVGAMKDERGQRLLKGVQSVIDARKAQAAREAEEELAREEAEKAARARLHQIDNPETVVDNPETVVDDEVAIAYIQRQPHGYFRTAQDLEALFVRGDEGDETIYVIDMVTKTRLTLKDARVIRYCFITDEEGAKRLVKQLPRREGKDRDRYYHLEPTYDRLKERDAARTEQEQREKAFETEIMKELEPEATSFENLARAYLVVLADNTEGGQNGEVPEWKLRIISAVAGELEEGRNGVRYRFVGELRERFPNGESVAALEAYIEELRTAYKEYTGAAKVREKMFKKVQVATTHLEWLKEHSEGVDGRRETEDRPERTHRRREDEPRGTHFYTKGTPERPVFTEHLPDEERERNRRERRERDRKHTQETRGMSGGGGGKKGGKKGK